MTQHSRHDSPGSRIAPSREEILKSFTPDSGNRILDAIAGYTRRYNERPDKVLVDAKVAAALKEHIFTELGWKMLTSRVQLVEIPDRTIVAEGKDGRRYEHGEDEVSSDDHDNACVWVWQRAL